MVALRPVFQERSYSRCKALTYRPNDNQQFHDPFLLVLPNR